MTEPSPDERRVRLEDATRRLDSGLADALGDRLHRDGSKPTERQHRVVVTAYDLGAPCPARWAHPGTGEFMDSAANSARRLGRLALRSWRPPTPLNATVDGVLADTADWDTGLRTWFEGLDRSGRAAVASATTTWAVGALGAVGDRQDLTWSRANETVDVSGRAVRLVGSWDAFSGTRRRPVTVLVMSNAAPSRPADALTAAFQALVAGWGPRTVPERVRIGSAAAGTTRAVPITAGRLSAVVDRIVELVSWRVAPELAPAVPGRGCGHCHLLESCDAGSAHLGRPPPD